MVDIVCLRFCGCFFASYMIPVQFVLLSVVVLVLFCVVRCAFVFVVDVVIIVVLGMVDVKYIPHRVVRLGKRVLLRRHRREEEVGLGS